jgi:hypothetical protein
LAVIVTSPSLEALSAGSESELCVVVDAAPIQLSLLLTLLATLGLGLASLPFSMLDLACGMLSSLIPNALRGLAFDEGDAPLTNPESRVRLFFKVVLIGAVIPVKLRFLPW